MKTRRVIIDRKGREHTVAEDWISPHDLIVTTSHAGSRSAYINCLLIGVTLRIQDFKVKDDFLPSNWLAKILFGKRSLRNQGLGSKLLAYLDERARELKIKIIKGDVVPRDREATPHLLQFYIKSGFRPEPDNQASAGIITIIKHL